MSYSEIENGYKYSHFATQNSVDNGGDNTCADSGKQEINYGDYKAFGKEYSEYVIPARAYSTQYAYFMLFV